MRQRLLSCLVNHCWHSAGSAGMQIPAAGAVLATYNKQTSLVEAYTPSYKCIDALLDGWAAHQHVRQRLHSSTLQLPTIDSPFVQAIGQPCVVQQTQTHPHTLAQSAWQAKQQGPASSPQEQQQHAPPPTADISEQQQQGSRPEAGTQEQSSTESNSGTADSTSSSHSNRGPPDETLLQEWRTSSSQWYGTGLQYIMLSHLRTPNISSWSTIYQQKQTFLERLLRPKGASYFTWLLKWIFRPASAVAVPLLEEAHGDFELGAFKEGASQAIASVLQLYATADWASLRQMVSSGLLQSMQTAYHEQQDIADEHNVKVSSVDISVDKLEIVCVHSITQQQLAEIDEQRSNQQLTATEIEASAAAAAGAAAAAAAEGAAAVLYWDVVHVYAEVTLHASYVAGVADVHDDAMPRSGHWALCRGPVPVNKPVAADADKPWFMLAWM